MQKQLLKRSILFAGILLICGMAQAQTGSTDTTNHRIRPSARGAFHQGMEHRNGFAHRGNGIRYTPEQRRQLMAINKEYHDKSAELFKKDNITLKEYKASLLALQKDKRSKTEALLTPQQKEQIAQRKKRAEENRQVAEAARMERLKLRLNLTDDQVTKIKAGQEGLRAQFKSIHENDNLLPQEKMEQMKGLMAKRKDVFKSVLTPEQFSKFEEMSHKRGFGRDGHDGPGGRGGWDRGRHAIDNEGPDGQDQAAI